MNYLEVENIATTLMRNYLSRGVVHIGSVEIPFRAYEDFNLTLQEFNRDKIYNEGESARFRGSLKLIRDIPEGENDVVYPICEFDFSIICSNVPQFQGEPCFDYHPMSYIP